MRYMVTIQGPDGSYYVYGPFNMHMEAIKWAQVNLTGKNWYVAQYIPIGKE